MAVDETGPVNPTENPNDTPHVERRNLKEHPTIKRVLSSLRVTKVVCTRSVKGRSGDHYVGFAAAWDSTQDDAARAADLVTTLDDVEVAMGQAQGGLTLKEAKVASLLLGLQADRAAHQNAWAGGNIPLEVRNEALRAINANYGKLLLEAVGEEDAGASNGRSE
jgi:hypothetical protein